MSSIRPTRRVISILTLTALFGALPLLFTTNTLDPNLHLRFLTLGVILAGFFLLGSTFIWRNTNSLQLPAFSAWGFAALLGYACAAAVSVLYAVNFAEAVFDATRVGLWLALLTALTWMLLTDDDMLTLTARLITIMALVQCIIGLLQYYHLGFSWIPGVYEPYGSLGQSHLYASFLLLSSPFALFLCFRQRGAWRWTGALTLILSVVGITLGKSRAVWLAAVVAGALTAGFYLSEDSPRPKAILKIIRKLFIPSLIIIAVMLILALTGKIPIPVSDHGRIQIWKNTIAMTADHFPGGVSAGNWRIFFPLYSLEQFQVDIAEGWTNLVRPHNEFLLVASETGLLGLIGWLAFLIILFIIIIRAARKTDDPQRRLIMYLMFFGLAAYLIASSFSFERERIEHNLLLILMAAVVFSQAEESSRPSIKLRGHCLLLIWLSSALIGVWGAYLGGQRLRAEIHTSNAALARLNADWQRVVIETDRAETRWYTVDPTSVPVRWYRGVANFTLGNFSEATEDFTEALICNPNHLHSLINLAACYARADRNEEAIEYYQKALHISPYFSGALLNLSAVFYNMGRYEDAFRTIKKMPRYLYNQQVEEFYRRIKEKCNE